MKEVRAINPQQRGEDISREICRLLLFYRQLTELLEVCFSGYLMIVSDELNMSYLRLCRKVSQILEKPGFEDLARYHWQPFDSLRALDPDGPDIDWEYGGRQVCGNFLSAVEEVFISTGQTTYSLDADDKSLLGSIEAYLQQYRSYKSSREKKWLREIEMRAREPAGEQEPPEVRVREFDFGFIGDDVIRNLLIEDWQEARKAFEKGLHKSTVILCGAVLEALLIDALSLIEKEAKLSYEQKYLQGKRKGGKPPIIESWLFYQLIEIAKQQGVIGADVARLSHVVRDYRNLIHLWAQKREQLRVDSNVATAVVALLGVAHRDIAEWHEKRRNA